MSEPLQDLDAERTVIGAILAYGREQLSAAAELLEPRHFADKRHARAFEAALAIMERGDSVDVVTVRAEIGSDPESYLVGLTDGVPRITSMGDWARIVLDKARRRAAHNLAKKLVEQALDEGVSTDEMLDRHQSALSRLIEVTSAGTLLTMRDVLKQAQVGIDRFVTSTTGATGITSGFPDLDEITGGFQPGTLVVIAARPGQGKSTLLANIAAWAGQRNYRGLMFSMEMPPAAIGERMLFADAGVEKWDLRTGDRAWPRLAMSVGKLSQHPTLWDSREAPTMAQIWSRSTAVHQKAKLDFIGVDHIQRVAFDGRLEERIGVGRTAQGLKRLAMNTGTVVIAPCQLNRQAEKSEPTLAELAESGHIEREADIVLFLHPDQETKNQNFPVTHLIIGKHRAGAAGRMKLWFEKPFCRLLPMVKETKENAS
jgi:replicative DNA helicase